MAKITLTLPIISGGGGGSDTNLSYISNPTQGTVISDTGTDAIIPLADGTNAGLLKPAKFTVLENTSGTNTGDQDLSGLQPKAISITYSALKTLVDTSALVVGQRYIINDYQTVHNIPNTSIPTWDGDNYQYNWSAPAVNTAEVEPLLVTALKVNQLASECYSLEFPQDIIYYDINSDQAIVSGCTKGYIFRRIDTQLNNDIGFDFRKAKFRIYKESATTTYGVAYYVTDPFGYGDGSIYFGYKYRNNVNYVECNPAVYQDVTMFNDATDYKLQNIYNNYFVQNTSDIINRSCSVFFGTDFNNNTVGNSFYNNTVGTNFYNNTVGNSFNNNTVENSFYNNIVGNNFNNNIVGNSFNNNTVGNNFNYNIVENSFYNNTVGNNFNYNTVENDFNYNIVGNSFYNNIVGNSFYNNTVGNDFYNNIVENDFNNNIVGNDFHNNTVGNSFNYNTVGNNFNNNIVGNSFYNNTVGTNFYNNTVGINFYNNIVGNSFYNNIVGNNFNYNTVENDFNYNTVENDFYNNIVGINFYNNTVGNDFNNNIVGNNFNNNTVENDFNNNTVGNSFYNNIVGNNFRKNNVELNIQGKNFITPLSTYVYLDYQKYLFKNSTGVDKLRYYDATDTLIIVNANA